MRSIPYLLGILIFSLLGFQSTPAQETRYGISLEAVLPLRGEANDSSEQVSQILFGEAFQILKSPPEKDWLYIQNSFDGYQGWLPKSAVTPINAEYYQSYLEHSHHLSQDHQGIIQMGNQKQALAQGSILPFYEKGYIQVNDKKYSFKGKVSLVNAPYPKDQLIRVAKSYLGAPYLWGGKTERGLDCSGFTQMVFRQSGYPLPRDSYQQAEVGEKFSLSQAKVGDLVFFQRKAEGDGKVVHVGIYLGKGKLIHSDGKVRINRLDETGLYRDDLGKYSHFLKFLRRIE